MFGDLVQKEVMQVLHVTTDEVRRDDIVTSAPLPVRGDFKLMTINYT
jgi:hypothetical protein